MKVRLTNKKTPRPWELDLGVIDRKRVREFFETEALANAAMKERLDERRLNGVNSILLTPRLRLEYAEAEKRLIKIGKTIGQAVDFIERFGQHCRPVKITEAVVSCIAAKRAAGNREIYVDTLERSLNRLATACPGMTDEIKSEQVERWIWSSPDPKKKPALETVRSRLIDARTLFNFCLKRKWIMENPCKAIEPVKLEQKAPGIHTVEQVALLLNAALKHDPAIIGFIAPIYFGGLRPAEARKLVAAEVHGDVIEVQGPKGKGRRRRFVPINDTLKAWLAVPGVEYGLSVRSRRLDALRWIAGGSKREKKGTRNKRITKFPWPHDVLRHTFCSYALPQFGASKTAEWAGHSEQILFAHYRERVKPADVASFWSLRP